MGDPLKNRDRREDCAQIERELPGWTAKFLSPTLNYCAMSPDYDARVGRGHLVIGQLPKDVIERVRKGQEMHARAGKVRWRSKPKASDSRPADNELPREDTSEERNNPIGDRELAIKMGYTGDPCSNCGAMMLVPNGSCFKCMACGETTGCS